MYIDKTRTEVNISQANIVEKRELFSQLGCGRSVAYSDIDTEASWAKKLHAEMLSEEFLLGWPQVPMAKKTLYCVVLYNSIQRHQDKLNRKAGSLESLVKLREKYDELLFDFDRTGMVDSRWTEALGMAEQYERFAIGIKSISDELHAFLISKEPMEHVGEMFWDPENSGQVLRDIVHSIMREEDDVMKLRIALEMIEKSKTMRKWVSQEIIKNVVDQYKDEHRSVGNDLFNTEQRLLSFSH